MAVPIGKRFPRCAGWCPPSASSGDFSTADLHHHEFFPILGPIAGSWALEPASSRIFSAGAPRREASVEGLARGRPLCVAGRDPLLAGCDSTLEPVARPSRCASAPRSPCCTRACACRNALRVARGVRRWASCVERGASSARRAFAVRRPPCARGPPLASAARRPLRQEGVFRRTRYSPRRARSVSSMTACTAAGSQSLRATIGRGASSKSPMDFCSQSTSCQRSSL